MEMYQISKCVNLRLKKGDTPDVWRITLSFYIKMNVFVLDRQDC